MSKVVISTDHNKGFRKAMHQINMDISLGVRPTHTRLSICIENILIQGRVSQIIYLGHSFHFRAKNG